ncbi:MAG: hypothetical protein Ct9H300mP23_02150 [Nitrospinota bacterium]|nr:MAG: hypothetical protein Ct9H300mP23_02150 [Nitrospinota bacterium]
MITKIPTIECGAIPAAQLLMLSVLWTWVLCLIFTRGGVSVSDSEKVKELWGETAPRKLD